MTLRDYFAGQALAGIAANSAVDMTDLDTAIWAYEMADTMLKVRGE
jgi:hypothetical protein